MPNALVVLLCLYCVLCACGQPSESTSKSTSESSALPIADDDTLRHVRKMLSEYQRQSGCRMYVDLVDAMDKRKCLEGSCLGLLSKRDTRNCGFDRRVSHAAVVLLNETDSLLRVGLEIACSLCAAQGMPCLCEGRECEPQDVMVAGVSVMATIDCGGTFVEGARLQWGAQVRDHPPIDILKSSQ